MCNGTPVNLVLHTNKHTCAYAPPVQAFACVHSFSPKCWLPPTAYMNIACATRLWEFIQFPLATKSQQKTRRETKKVFVISATNLIVAATTATATHNDAWQGKVATRGFVGVLQVFRTVNYLWIFVDVLCVRCLFAFFDFTDAN